MSLGRLLATFYAVVFLALSLFAGISIFQTRSELNNLRAQEAESRRRLAEAEERLAEQERTLRQIGSDPAFVESVIRRKLGYAKPDEVVFRFQR